MAGSKDLNTKLGSGVFYLLVKFDQGVFATNGANPASFTTIDIAERHFLPED